jgi:hypothetical protein
MKKKATKKVIAAKKKPVANKKVAASVSQKAAPKPPPKPTKAKPVASAVDEYVAKVVPWQRAVIEKLRAVVKEAAPEAVESIKWGQPVYEHSGPFAYIKAHAAQVNFGFWRGAELDDPKRLLQGEGEKMRHVKILETHVLDEPALAAFVKQASSLNAKKGDPTKG